MKPFTSANRIATGRSCPTAPSYGSGAIWLVTVSIGYATQCSNMHFNDVESFTGAAEQALYTAKLQGRNRCLPYEASLRTPTVQFL